VCADLLLCQLVLPQPLGPGPSFVQVAAEVGQVAGQGHLAFGLVVQGAAWHLEHRQVLHSVAAWTLEPPSDASCHKRETGQ